MKKIKRIAIIIAGIVCILLTAIYFYQNIRINHYMIQGLIYESEFQFEEAIKKYEEADNSITMLNKLATLYNRTGKRDKAVKTLKRILEIDSDNIEAHFDLAGTHYAMKQFEDAIRKYELVLNLNPLSVASLNSLGNIYYDLEKTDKAIEYYKRAIAINPNFAPVCNDLGNAYHSQGRIEEAITEYKKALTLDVDFNLARQNLRLAEEELQKSNF